MAKQTAASSFINELLFKNIPALIQQKYVAWLFLRKLRYESQFLGSYFQINNLKVYANYVQCNLTRCY